MVQAAIAAEEECKSMSYAQGLAHSSMSLAHRPPCSSRGRACRPAQDGLLPVHALVLIDVPATLRASTLTLKCPRRRCPPAAQSRSCTGRRSGRRGSAPSGDPHLPSQPSPNPWTVAYAPRQPPKRTRVQVIRMPLRATPAASWLPSSESPEIATSGIQFRTRRYCTIRRAHCKRWGEVSTPSENGHARRGHARVPRTLAHTKGEGHAAQEPRTTEP